MLRNQIISAIRASETCAKEDAIRAISANITYATASPDHLAQALSELVQTGHSSLRVTTDKDVLAMVDKYSSNIPTQLVREDKKVRSGLVVAITGTTGGLGSHLLAQLLKDSSIERIYALNRPSLADTVHEKQRRSFEARYVRNQLDHTETEHIRHADTWTWRHCRVRKSSLSNIMLECFASVLTKRRTIRYASRSFL
jgi:FlaA1/EpsC-like NDP-sugar epimerase